MPKLHAIPSPTERPPPVVAAVHLSLGLGWMAGFAGSRHFNFIWSYKGTVRHRWRRLEKGPSFLVAGPLLAQFWTAPEEDRPELTSIDGGKM